MNPLSAATCNPAQASQRKTLRIAGMLCLQPWLLNYIVAIYLIIVGLVGLLGVGAFNLSA